jgi:two-component system, NarL family, nitrate/nitrite response regulator NarL
MAIGLVLADDHPIVLDGLKQLFALEADFRVVACAANGDEALEAVRRHRPEILVLDLRMPGKDGLAVLREMSRERLPTRTIVLTAVGQDEVFEAIRLGVHGVVLKDMAPRLLVHCVREVHAGRKWLERGHATRAVEKLLSREAVTRDINATLTPRELRQAPPPPHLRQAPGRRARGADAIPAESRALLGRSSVFPPARLPPTTLVVPAQAGK